MNEKNDLEYSLQIEAATKVLLQEQIEKLKDTIHELEMEELAGISQTSEHSHLKTFEKNSVLLKEMLDKSKMKMLGMKEQFDKLKAYNEQLISERSVLAKRAAVGFS